MGAIDSTRNIAASARRWSTNPVSAILAWLFALLAIAVVWAGKIILVTVILGINLINFSLPRR